LKPGRAVETANHETAQKQERHRRANSINAKAPRLGAAEPQPNGNAFNAETPRTQRAAELFL